MTLADRHGDVIAGFDPTAYDITMNDTAEFDPFGKRVDSSGTERPIGYQGDYADPDTGDVNMTARWYDPTAATFTSRLFLCRRITSQLHRLHRS
ncbi:RHS repeat-associated core domain-containing protein [Actinophytocola sediminis]